MSHEHKALGYRPPPGSLAAEAQSAAARHPEGDGTHLDDETLREIAVRDAERIKADRELNMVGEVNVSALSKGRYSSPSHITYVADVPLHTQMAHRRYNLLSRRSSATVRLPAVWPLRRRAQATSTRTAAPSTRPRTRSHSRM